jgi:hypothetical protein
MVCAAWAEMLIMSARTRMPIIVNRMENLLKMRGDAWGDGNIRKFFQPSTYPQNDPDAMGF